MTPEELQEILSTGSLEEQIAELLRRQEEAEARGEATLDDPTGQMVGDVYVANVPGMISNMFVRGRAKKEAKGYEAERAAATKKRDAAIERAVEGMLGRNLEEIQPAVPRIGTPPSVDVEAAKAVLDQPFKPAPGSMRPMPDRIPQGARPDPSVPPPGARIAPSPAPPPPPEGFPVETVDVTAPREPAEPSAAGERDKEGIVAAVIRLLRGS